jgi:cullin 3
MLLSKLKGECGTQYTSKMEGMLLDIHILSRELMDAYKQSQQQAQSSSGIELDVQTLTQSHWPLKQLPGVPHGHAHTSGKHGASSSSLASSINVGGVTLPSAVIDSCTKFQQFYVDKFKTGRRLQWLTHLGSADIKANFSKGRKELNVSTYQMCMLMCFNSQPSIPFQKLKDMVCVPEPELRRHLLSLCTSKLRILKKSSKSRVRRVRTCTEWWCGLFNVPAM